MTTPTDAIPRSSCDRPLNKLIIDLMRVLLAHPDRQLEIKGPKRVRDLFRELNLANEAFLAIRENTLVTEDELLKDEDEVEIRPVISGGSL